jgi:hypothetical protein
MGAVELFSLLFPLIVVEVSLTFLFYYYLNSMHKSLRTIAEKVGPTNSLASAPQAAHAGYQLYPGNPANQYKP